MNSYKPKFKVGDFIKRRLIRENKYCIYQIIDIAQDSYIIRNLTTLLQLRLPFHYVEEYISQFEKAELLTQEEKVELL